MIDAIDFNIDTRLKQLLNSEQAYHYRIVPIAFENNTIVFKTDTITNEVLQELQVVFDKNIQLEKESPENIHKYLTTNFRKQATAIKTDLHYSTDFLEKLLLSAKNIG